jgi:NAD(P)-dependent dehydrogenase (short-subunit alcohol dehydrogenase family)|tara:strand:- start:172 stop:306 length:135 start_codon:yes stop_codon:yes gene_type:complete
VKKYIEKKLLKRMAMENDIAGYVAFLLSSLNSYITDQGIIVDGG